jgi:hypothetical protein
VAFAVLKQVSDPDDDDDNNNDDGEMEEDLEFIQPPRKKVKSSLALCNTMNNACIKCQWRKCNSECQLRMCLSCCVKSSHHCSQHSHLAAKSSKNTILFLEHEIKAGKKPKTPKLRLIVNTPPAHPDITAFLQQSTVTTIKDHPTPIPPSMQNAFQPLSYPLSPPFTYVEPSSLHMFLVSIQFQQYLPTLINNGFKTMMAMATLNELLLNALGIHSLGHRAVLLSAVSKLRQSQQHQLPYQQHPRRVM